MLPGRLPGWGGGAGRIHQVHYVTAAQSLVTSGALTDHESSTRVSATKTRRVTNQIIRFHSLHFGVCDQRESPAPPQSVPSRQVKGNIELRER